MEVNDTTLFEPDATESTETYVVAAQYSGLDVAHLEVAPGPAPFVGWLIVAVLVAGLYKVTLAIAQRVRNLFAGHGSVAESHGKLVLLYLMREW